MKFFNTFRLYALVYALRNNIFYAGHVNVVYSKTLGTNGQPAFDDVTDLHNKLLLPFYILVLKH
ncbi:hypothetical protein CH330_00415 [candidate division WOR-3 bacterium JGI_Cruoil_03_51_56]|uniref:Uncharacterized protein n=1 Tax=candidate division WOR-3 bacterium JGI_Cruoil_03_51_56 TaxID=1973747 RepID=A0A235BYC3_UNCW3|nr:MAG: hypothetical protein CH330_00415 [candidate division WOR-3 bacterium JGI_Cruoil_03_51_56]